jgi:spoIIIJ-associated protein
MNEAKEIIEHLITLMGFKDFSVSYLEDSKRFLIFINDAPFLKKFLPQFISDFEFILKTIFNKKKLDLIFIDINNYRKEREELIIKLAKAAAKKSLATKQEVALPPMNAYERRIVHSELSLHPDIKTESYGEGKHRHVVVKPII